MIDLKECKREIFYGECRSCGDQNVYLVRYILPEPEIVNPGTQWEWVRTEIVSKCISCYL